VEGSLRTRHRPAGAVSPDQDPLDFTGGGADRVLDDAVSLVWWDDEVLDDPLPEPLPGELPDPPDVPLDTFAVPVVRLAAECLAVDVVRVAVRCGLGFRIVVRVGLVVELVDVSADGVLLAVGFGAV
jgi:hypothetical protein